MSAPRLTQERLDDLSKEIVYWRTIHGTLNLNPNQKGTDFGRLTYQSELAVKIDHLVYEHDTLKAYLES